MIRAALMALALPVGAQTLAVEALGPDPANCPLPGAQVVRVTMSDASILSVAVTGRQDGSESWYYRDFPGQTFYHDSGGLSPRGAGLGTLLDGRFSAEGTFCTSPFGAALIQATTGLTLAWEDFTASGDAQVEDIYMYDEMWLGGDGVLIVTMQMRLQVEPRSGKPGFLMDAYEVEVLIPREALQ